ncbi:autotransporter outer membrane beta-barrel domain-containing protein [Salmonella enterica]|nr:autotransporter outer membrane beta-barrel domain-containing protein [Salmonella enterica]
MTVENKFKRNVLAASILVGLSLSAASGVAWADGDVSETSPLQPEPDFTIGEVVLPGTETEGDVLSVPESEPTKLSSPDGELNKENSEKDLDGPGANPPNSDSVNDENKQDTEKNPPIETEPKESEAGNTGQQGALGTLKDGTEGGGENVDDKDNGILDKVINTVAGIFGSDGNKDDPSASSEPKNDNPGTGNDEIDDSEHASTPPVNQNGGDKVASESDKQPEIDGKPVVGEGTEPGKQPELDGKPAVDGGSESGKQPEPDGKPAVDGGSESGKQPELDGKPVVGEGTEPGKQPEPDGKPAVDGGSEPGKQPEPDGKPVVGEGTEPGKQSELDGKPAVGDGTEPGKQPEPDGKPVVGEGTEPGKQPELDGKPAVGDGTEPGKQPELDGKPVVGDGTEPGKQPELDGKPAVGDGTEPGKQPELDGKPAVGEGTESDKQPEVGSKPAPVEKPVAEKPAEQPVVKPAEPKRTYSAAELNTLTKDKALTKALSIDASQSATDTKAVVYSLGDAASKDGKVTPSTIRAESSVAVELAGTLRTAQPELDKDGKPVAGKVVRDADKIILQNINIHNSMPSIADRVGMLSSDIAGIRIGTQTASDTGASSAAPKDASILLDNVNITMQGGDRGAKAIDLTGNSNHILAKGGTFDAGGSSDENYSRFDRTVLDISGSNNVVDFVGSTLKGDIKSGAPGYTSWMSSAIPVPVDNTVNLRDSTLTGDAVAHTGSLHLKLDGSTWTGHSGEYSPDVTLSNGSVWNVTGVNGRHYNYSSVNSLTLNGSNTLNLIAPPAGKGQLGSRGFIGDYSRGMNLGVDTDLMSDGKGVTAVNIGAYSPEQLHRLNNTGSGEGYEFGRIDVDGLALGGQYRLLLESAGAEPYTVGGRLADGFGADKAHEFVSYQISENRPVTDKDGKTVIKDGKTVTQLVTSDADFTSLSAPVELGVYQYAAEKVMDGVNNRTGIYYTSTGKLSNSAATAVSMAAAPVDVANLESDTLAKHMNSVRHGKDSGVWLSYFGGETRNTTEAGPEYKLKTNGVMLGVDTLTENDWLAGVAVSSARSDLSVMNSSGDLNSYGAQFYMSRRYDSGVFVDGALQFNHFSNTAKARMINGQQAKADFSGNSYGLEAKVGYAWNDNGFFAEPYVRAAARAFDGEHYNLSNGMTVNSNDYKSMLGEVGADVGYQYDLSGGYVKPYLHLAALNEFADGNSVRVNNVSLDNSVKGSAFQVGVGAELKMTDNFGGYAAFDYTKGENTERPWQATVGVNYTW